MVYVNGKWEVVSIETTDQSLDRRLFEIANIGSDLARLFVGKLKIRHVNSTIRACGMVLNASMTTFPRTDWMGSMTTDTDRGWSCSQFLAICTSTPESQHPKPGCEWYQPTTFSVRPVCLRSSCISDWYQSSTDSTLTVEPAWGIENTSLTTIVYSSTIVPNMRPRTSRGTPARPKSKQSQNTMF